MPPARETPGSTRALPSGEGGVRTKGLFPAGQTSGFIAKSMAYENRTCPQTPRELGIQIRSSLLVQKPAVRQCPGGEERRPTPGSSELAAGAVVPETQLSSPRLP